jgi:uncharacterized protein YqhQ
MAVSGNTLPAGVMLSEGGRCALAYGDPQRPVVEVFPATRLPLGGAFNLLAQAVDLFRAYARLYRHHARGMTPLEIALALFLTALQVGVVLYALGKAHHAAPSFLGKTGGLLLAGLFLFALLYLTSRLTPMARLHAAEHRVTHLLERGLPLEVEAARAMPNLHPRCGVSLLALSFALAVALSPVVPVFWATLLSFPLGYGLLRRFPALARLTYSVQALTLSEPTEAELSLALAAARALRG